ncbi:hypothetical protein MGG_17895 [Pyricularia oryzae 70-15]|uniref:Uncharacterized protein n=1 Tax=Pyricularia oryzae (strain 70-15 / ATCC MYA-4617 / FGSC 8958) TaxID=242507 RepID=G4NL22_PYRO7|nr:uncharacterized protein MGG_17895 [Pyricularia oryzae 70-15]EHA45955.1 hypothetical protein MGG_17895 [Pyricularia oryzae 70-15]KAI7911236.1 hypothetical protein M9X92_010635 [Pyricularia oryzae]KAI7912591.1 hypothetical protein M0657_010393 [Pyricularia oryzae]
MGIDRADLCSLVRELHCNPGSLPTLPDQLGQVTGGDGQGRNAVPRELSSASARRVTVTSIITDFGCTILPGVMLCRSPTGQSNKIHSSFLFSVASVACVAAITRAATYISRYANPSTICFTTSVCKCKLLAMAKRTERPSFRLNINKIQERSHRIRP